MTYDTGALLAAEAGRRVDASVVIGVLARGDLVVTSDADDLERLAAALGRREPPGRLQMPYYRPLGGR